MLLCLRRMATLWNQPVLKSLTLPIYSFTGEDTGKTVSLLPEVFSVPLRQDLVHNAFQYYRMMNVITTHRTKRRVDMIASKRKYRPQKGTGRARAGFRYAHRMKGGVKAHGPVPRNFSIKMNKKMVLKALQTTLAVKLAETTMVIVDQYPSHYSKTKELAKDLEFFGLKSILIHSQEFTPNFSLAARNLDYFKMFNFKEFNVRDLVVAPKILITLEAILALQQNLLQSTKKLYTNRKLYRKVNESAKQAKAIEPVVIKTRVLKEIAKKYELDVETS